MRTKNRAATGGFTIVELLTVIAVIILIISMIVPGINYSKRIAKEMRVRSQIKGLGEAVEAFYGVNEFYPPSAESSGNAAQDKISDRTVKTDITCGAQKLAAALMGIDLHGYDPQGDFDLKTCEANARAYAIAGVGGATQVDEDRSIARRKEMYTTPSQDMVACDLAYLYAGTSNTQLYAGGDPTNKKMGPVICDGMKVKEIVVPTTNPVGTATLNPGTPYLYFKANTDSKKFDKNSDINNIYNYLDNRSLLDLVPLSGEKAAHAWNSTFPGIPGNPNPGRTAFYDAITNPAITTEARPYNMDSYLIISAGTDGIYGTRDDIANFKK